MLKGIDVSTHQGVIDWKKVKESGVEFAFIRIGWAGYDGRIVANRGLDSRFHQNVKDAISADIPVGIYVYAYCDSPNAAEVAADEVLELVKDYKITYPIVFDMETEGTKYRTFTRATNTDIAKAFLQRVEAKGYYSMLYTYKSFAENNLNMVDLKAYDLWIAQIASNVTYKGAYGIWQYSWTLKVPGIVGAVDGNIAYKDYAKLIQEAGLNNLSETSTPTDYKALYEKEQKEHRETKAQLKDIQNKNDKLMVLYAEIRKLIDSYLT